MEASRDQNRVTTLLGVSSADGVTPVTVYVNPTTHRMLVDTGGGGGAVTGPVSSTDNAVVRWDGAGGNQLQDSGLIISDTNNLSGINNLTIGGTATIGSLAGIIKAAAGVLSAATAGTDYYAPGSTDVAVADGGTGASTAAGARTNLGLVINTDVQAFNAILADLAGLTQAGDKGIYFDSATTAATYDLSAFARTLLDDANAGAARTTLGLAIGTDVQAYSAVLASVAASTYAGDDAIVTVGTLSAGDATAIVAAASATAAGKVELATDAETVTGTDTVRAVTPANLVAKMAAPGAIGGTTPAAGTFTTLTPTTLVIGGDIQFDGTPNADDTFVGPSTNTFNAGATIAQWDAIYMGASSTWLLTDADAAATAGGVFVAMATAAATSGNPLRVLLPGSFARNDAWNWTPGAPLYLDTTTAGGLIATAPSGTDDVVRIVAYAVTADVIFWNPSNDWITRV